MRTQAITALKLIAGDRSFLMALGGLIILSLAYCIYVGVSLQPIDVQVIVHYTAYGEQSFYRDQWWYLFSFIGFGLIIGVVHSSIAVKLYQLGHSRIAYGFIAISAVVLAIGFYLTKAVLGAAYFQ